MHDCQKFREDWIGGDTDCNESAEDCVLCRQFCDDASAVLFFANSAQESAIDSSEEYWTGFDRKLVEKLESVPPGTQTGTLWRALAFATAAAAVVGVTWGGLRWSAPIVNNAPELRLEVSDRHIAGLDSKVSDYLGQSELFLRSFTKIEPSHIEDIDDARDRARRQLAEISEQRLAVGDFQPVRVALDEYESVLREIKNLDSTQDLRDIQIRVNRNGLIASFQAYQPRLVLASQR